MNKFENIYQDAALMRKFLLGEANEAERKELEKRLAECPDLKKVYEQLQNGETLKAAFGEYKDYSSKKAYQSFLQKIGRMEKKERKPSISRVCCCGCHSSGCRPFILYVEFLFGSRGEESSYSAGYTTGAVNVT